MTQADYDYLLETAKLFDSIPKVMSIQTDEYHLKLGESLANSIARELECIAERNVPNEVTMRKMLQEQTPTTLHSKRTPT